MKTYVITVSEVFPKTHNRAGQPTNFISSIKHSLKKHTIRSNYNLWEKRFNKINNGEALLSVRVWEGKPYNSKQREIFSFNAGDGIGLEKLDNPNNFVFASVQGWPINWDTVAVNDGLSFKDFCEWFKVRQAEPMAIIHFTDFRYCR